MKKIDKLVLNAFIGPLILTFLVVIFILLSKQMLYYFDDIIGKGLGLKVLTQFFVYFSILMLPAAMPLSILLASLITFGNLAEHFELKAIKASGISLLRVLQPIFFLVLLLTGIAFYANNFLVPRAALEAYTLLYDIRQKKPALDIREGVFYNGIPDISIKVNQKFPDDDAALKDIILYNHLANEGNKEVLIADSGRMSTIFNERYLKFEFFNGFQYTQSSVSDGEIANYRASAETFTRRSFLKSEIVVNLSSFDLSRTDAKLFGNNRLMRNLPQLEHDADSIKIIINREKTTFNKNALSHFGLSKKNLKSVFNPDENKTGADSLFAAKPVFTSVQRATNSARGILTQMQTSLALIEGYEVEHKLVEIQWHKIIANALACITMFMIGAPLGSIIKRGGIGIPFLVSILFFIVYTLLGMQGEKLSKHNIFTAAGGVWMANFLFLAIGMVLLCGARNDVRLFETDFYKIPTRQLVQYLKLKRTH